VPGLFVVLLAAAACSPSEPIPRRLEERLKSVAAVERADLSPDEIEQALARQLRFTFSNETGSLMTSLGAFVTGGTYSGRNGYSLRLRGMDPGVNNRAEARAIVLHGAPCVSEEVAHELGRLGRSSGCPAVSTLAGLGAKNLNRR